MTNPLFSKSKTGGRDDWQTPEIVLQRVRRVNRIGLDPCTTDDNPAKAEMWASVTDGLFSKSDPRETRGVREIHEILDLNAKDGLQIPWHWWVENRGLVFVNPPFSQLKQWLRKCQAEAKIGAEIIALSPARTDTVIWHEIQPRAVAFWRGRLTFNDPHTGQPKQYKDKKTGRVSNEPAPFPSALLYWGKNVLHFSNAFREVAKVVFWDHAIE